MNAQPSFNNDRFTGKKRTFLPQYLGEGKAHLVLAIGCTGGRHRSVAIAEHLADRYGNAKEYLVEVVHRDVTKPT